MENLSAPSSITQHSKNKKSQKNKETMIPETLEESLRNWKLPPFSASDVYKRRGIFDSSIIKTVEEEILLSDGYSSFPLFSDNLRRVYSKKYVWLHIGMIQVALRPTKLGSNASATICLRNKSSGNFFDSVFGMVESSLCDGPICFSYFPCQESYMVYLSDDLSRTFSIDVKTEGYCSRDEKTLVLMYRLHYRVLKKQGDPRTRGSSSYRVDEKGETTLFLTNLAERNRVWSKKICWDEVAVPERWVEWKETAEAHVLKVDVPIKDVRVEVEDGSILQISGKRINGGMSVTRRFGKCVRLENISENILRRMRLPEGSRPEQVKVAIENGVLTVTVAKESVGKKVQVKVVEISS